MPPFSPLLLNLAFAPPNTPYSPPSTPTTSDRDAILLLPRRHAPNELIEYIPLFTPHATTLILLSHGRGRILTPAYIRSTRATATEHNVSIILRNYPGYGSTPRGSRGTEVVTDAEDVMREVSMMEEARGVRWGLLGNSIGCGVTLWLAARSEVWEGLCGVEGRVVLVSPYVSYVELIWRWVFRFGAGWGRRWGRRWDLFPGLELARGVKGQVLVVAGREDKVVPVGNAQEICEVLRGRGGDGGDVRVCLLQGTGHREARGRADREIWRFLKGEEVREGIAELEAQTEWEEFENEGSD